MKRFLLALLLATAPPCASLAGSAVQFVGPITLDNGATTNGTIDVSAGNPLPIIGTVTIGNTVTTVGGSPTAAVSGGASQAANDALMGGAFHTSPITMLDGFQYPIQLDSFGAVKICLVDTAGTTGSPGRCIDPTADSGVSLNKINNTAALTGGVAGSLGIGGLAASGSLVAGNPLLDGCRAATTTPTAVTDGRGIALQCGDTGKLVVLPYSIKDNAVRVSASTSTIASPMTLLAAAGGSLKNYVTGLQCSNMHATTDVRVTLNDSSAATFIVPHAGGTNPTFPTPLATAVNTALTATLSADVATVYCSAQGYFGL